MQLFCKKFLLQNLFRYRADRKIRSKNRLESIDKNAQIDKFNTTHEPIPKEERRGIHGVRR